MNYRINTKVVSLVVILILIAVALFVHTLITTPTTEEAGNENTTSNIQMKEERLITAKHQYSEGIHTIAGKSELPTRCHLLITDPFTSPELDRVEIRFNTLLEGDECMKELYEVPFRVTFEAPEDVEITATWNGDPARINLIPLQPGETLEDEIYIKG